MLKNRRGKRVICIGREWEREGWGRAKGGVGEGRVRDRTVGSNWGLREEEGEGREVERKVKKRRDEWGRRQGEVEG